MFFYKTEQDAQLLDFVLLPAVALKWSKENPLWAQIIGPPGCGKTAHLLLHEDWEDAVFVSRLSKNTLISGFRPEGDLDDDPSLLPKLDGKVLIVKDFTCILQGPREERDAVIGQLRDVFDGTASRSLGNVGLQTYKSKFNVLLAVTPVIDGYYSINTQLGERFIGRREFASGRVEMTEAAFDHIVSGGRSTKFEALKQQFMEFVSCLPSVLMNKIRWTTDDKNRAIYGADFVANARSHVVREKGGKHIATRPAPEVGTRLVTQVAQTVAAYCVINGLPETTPEAWDFGGASVLRDTMPTPVAWVLSRIYKLSVDSWNARPKPNFTTKELLPYTRLGWATTEQVVTDLNLNGILRAKYVGKTGRRSTRYSLTNRSFEVIQATRLFDHYEEEAIDLTALRSKERARTKRKRRKKT